MYIPTNFKFDDESDKIAFMKKYSFASMITSHNQVPLATQLPFVIKETDGKLILSAHFAKVNEQAKYIEDNTSLVIFTEPHAYISPSHYDKVESVPTWDYIAVHAYGKATIINSEEEKLKALEEMIHFYEAGYRKQWDGLSEKFKLGMLQGIIAFELDVLELQGQQKLSQNKNINEIERIVNHLEGSDIATEKELAAYVKTANSSKM